MDLIFVDLPTAPTSPENQSAGVPALAAPQPDQFGISSSVVPLPAPLPDDGFDIDSVLASTTAAELLALDSRQQTPQVQIPISTSQQFGNFFANANFQGANITFNFGK